MDLDNDKLLSVLDEEIGYKVQGFLKANCGVFCKRVEGTSDSI